MKEPERDYSHRSLFDKLGVKSDSHVAVIGGPHDSDFKAQLNALLPKAASEALRTVYDIIFLRVDNPVHLKRIPDAKRHLKQDGALWIFHPKGKGANPSDAEVRAAGIAAGLVDNKICAYNDALTATRYVIPVAARNGQS
jgi:hypothetical protein